MKMEITDNVVIVYYNNEKYTFDRNDDRLNANDSNIPSEVINEIESRGFFFQDYPQTFT